MADTRKIFTLHAILNRVQQVFDERMLGKYFWVKVEVLKVNKDRRGHYYLELVEQVEDQVLAKCRGTIWSRHVERCVIDGGADLEKVVKDGAEILCYGEAIFHPVYGFSLHVIHVDYAFSLGEIERKKQQALLQLYERGLLGLNKQLLVPRVIQKIALVASVGTSGYADFVQHLERNPHQFSFDLTCYDTQVQGAGAVEQVIKQLDIIATEAYDVVVLIRGGGSKFDLDVFNAVQLAEKLAQMPLVVFTGIGHETDSTVADYVAHTYFKTPSAVAAYILAKALEFSVFLTQSSAILSEQCSRILEQRQTRLLQLEEHIGRLSQVTLRQNLAFLEAKTTSLAHRVKQQIQQSRSEMRLLELTLSTEAEALVKAKTNELVDSTTRLAFWGKQRLGIEKQNIARVQEMLVAQVKHKVRQAQVTLVQTQEILSLYDIEQLLKKGFAVVRYEGQVLQQHTTLAAGDVLDIAIYNKTYRLTIDKIEEIEQWKNLLTKEQPMN